MTKSRRRKDPFAAREAKKYDEPIPSREFILRVLEEAGVPLEYRSLCRLLGLEKETAQAALSRRLVAMTRDGQLISDGRGYYGLLDRTELAKGRVQGSKDGSGYLVASDATQNLYLSPTEMRKVFDGDIVLARHNGADGRGRQEGIIVEILQRSFKQLVGRYYSDRGVGFLVPANRRITHEIEVPPGQSSTAQDGQFVVGEITTYPSPRYKPVASIVEILGDTATPGLEIEIAIRNYGLPHEWPEPVSNQAESMAGAAAHGELGQRFDLRALPFVTIDGEDAKDFDDAVFAKTDSGGWRLFVAIADVSNYVDVASALDEEAKCRGNSVYFPGHVIPMLPEKLSNGICSLKPAEDRLVMVCEMEVDRHGEVTDYQFYEGIIRSHARLTYTEVSDMLEPGDAESAQQLQERLKNRYKSLFEHLQILYELYQCLREARERGGALDFDTTETRIVFGENRRIKEVVPVVRSCAHRMIEECMLCANVAAARLLQDSGLTILYRTHESPSVEKLKSLRDYLGEMGLHLGGGEKPQPKHYQILLQNLAHRPDSHLLHTMVIRSMMQATYQAENIGHFGLGYSEYTHFTSPIRRYPDLLVHRAIRSLLRSKKHNRHLRKSPAAPPLDRAHIYPYSANQIAELGVHCSATERRADAASYDVVDWLKCEYMQSRVGDEFDGTIAGVTGFGLFVELDGVYIEGLVHITALDNDYYHFDAVSHVLVGERRGKRFHMGDSVRVKVAAVNLDERKIDLTMLAMPGASKRRKWTGKSSKQQREARDKKRHGNPRNNRIDKERRAESRAESREESREESKKQGGKRDATPGKKRGARSSADSLSPGTRRSRSGSNRSANRARK